MKKVITIVLVCLVCAMIPCLGEGIDLDSMSLDELVELRNEVNEALFERDRFNEAFYYPGTYKIGTDIESGTYVVYAVECYSDVSWASVIITLSNSEDNVYRDKVAQWEVDRKAYQKIEISDEKIMVIDGGCFCFYKR